MSLVVNHNMMAMNTARNLNSHYSRLATSTQRLSSGLRINSAADDAAGLAIRELQRADIATLQQGARNASDAISMIQTADGALSVIDEKLIRMKELAEQAATGTYDSTQRMMIESEYQAMASEITRIANATDFNGIHLLNGNLSGAVHNGNGLTATGKMKIHFGTGNDSAEDYYYITIGNATASALGLGNASAQDAGYSVSTQTAAQQALAAINDAIVSKDKIRAHLGAMQNRLENTINNLNIQAENLQAAESRISDVDVATEMTEFVRNQILAQSAVAMLAQANSLPQMALQLIGG
ncbi:MAG: flagellin [Desulfovibrio sp.]|jgi:flagellin|nr:flagellin [Desulfovibrio sp.]